MKKMSRWGENTGDRGQKNGKNVDKNGKKYIEPWNFSTRRDFYDIFAQYGGN
jgi:hypothetical protein